MAVLQIGNLCRDVNNLLLAERYFTPQRESAREWDPGFWEGPRNARALVWTSVGWNFHHCFSKRILLCVIRCFPKESSTRPKHIQIRTTSRVQSPVQLARNVVVTHQTNREGSAGGILVLVSHHAIIYHSWLHITCIWSDADFEVHFSYYRECFVSCYLKLMICFKNSNFCTFIKISHWRIRDILNLNMNLHVLLECSPNQAYIWNYLTHTIQVVKSKLRTTLMNTMHFITFSKNCWCKARVLNNIIFFKRLF